MTKSYHLSKDNLVLTFMNRLKKPACRQIGMAKKITLLKSMLLAIVIAWSGNAFGQGSFTSAATDNWDTAVSWTLSSGSDADGIPDADDDVTITHSITVPTGLTVACNNISVANTAQMVKMQGAGSILEIYGTLIATATPTSETIIDCSADATAKVVFKRTTNGALFGATWAAIGTGLRFDVNLPTGITGTASTSVKAREITITSGTFDLGTFELRPDNGLANTGILTMETGAILKCLRLSRTGTANTPFASMIMNGTAKFQPNSSTASTTNYLPAVAGGFPVYTFGANSTIEYVGSSSGTISVVPYQNLAITLLNSGGSRTIAAVLTIAGNLTIGTATVSSNIAGTTVGGNITINGDGVLTAGSASATITGSGVSNALIVNNNGILTIVSRNTATIPPAAGTTTPFSTQYPGFETITLNTGSTVEYRVPGGTAMGTQDIQTLYGALPLNYQNLTVSMTSGAASQNATQYIPEGVSVAGKLKITTPTAAFVSTQDVIFNNTNPLTVGSLEISRTGASSTAVQNVKLAGQTYNITGATTLQNSGPLFQSNSTVLNFNGAVTASGTLVNQGILRFNNFEPTINFNHNLSDGASANTFSVTGTEVPVINFNNGTSGTPMTTSASNLRGTVTVNGYRTTLGSFRTSNATASAYSMNIAGTLNLGASTSVATNTGGGTNVLSGSGTIRLTGDYATQVSGYSTNNFQGTGTLHFAGSTSQAIPAGTYANVIVENAAGATLGGNATINNALTLTTGTLATAANALTLKGSTSGSGLIDTGASGTLVYNGAVAQTVSNLTASTANNLTIDNAAGVTVGADATVNNDLTIISGSLTVVSGKNLTVKNAVANNGALTIENNANLVQVNNVANTGSGSTIVKRNSNPLYRLDYTLWSSPVFGAQTLADFSPLTTVGRFYTYDSGVDLYTVAAPTTTFSTGTGYLIRMPNTDPTTNYDAGTATLAYPGAFTGTPNNGTVTLGSVTPLVSDKYYAVGNPYPSTIDANLFLSGNSTDGTLYFWRKTNGVANSTGSAYATWTTLGSASSNVAPNNITPDGTIAVGQGFIVKTGVAATTLNFTNAMRTANNSAQFFKTRQTAQKDRVWLNLTNTTGAFSQALVGYMDGATQGVDAGIDGKYINDSPIALTSNINNEEYVIQGRPAFDASDVVALNFKTDVAGDYTIAIDHVDGLFVTGQDVYLVDSKTGTETNLKDGSYTFNATTGVDNARFSLKYQKTLKVDAPAFNDNTVVVYKNKGTLFVNSGAIAINNIKVYDIQGRLIAEHNNVKAHMASITSLKATQQVLIVKVTGQDNSVVSKKVVN